MVRRLVVSEFVTVDGVMEDPGGAEGFERGGWAFRFDQGPDGAKFKLDETMAAGALLLGRRTYEGFAAAWPGRTDEMGFAEKMNTMPKYVVSSTLERADWSNSTILRGPPADEVAALKQDEGGEILVAGSGRLAHALLAHGLVDELRLMVFPVVLGAGRRLFAEGAPAASPLRLAESRPAGDCLILIYEPAEQRA